MACKDFCLVVDDTFVRSLFLFHSGMGDTVSFVIPCTIHSPRLPAKLVIF